MTEQVEITWPEKLTKMEQKFGSGRSVCRALHGVPDRTYAAWKAGTHTPPEWMQRVILDFLKRES